MQVSAVHAMFSHEFGFWHCTLHAHDGPHAMPRHDCEPEQIVLHGPGPHAMLRHELVPEQLMSHDAALAQSIPLRHEFPTVHPILHFQPGGQVINPWQLVGEIEQSMLHSIVPSLHDVHCDGQTSASGRAASATWLASMLPGDTHRLLLHTWLVGQSLCTSHVTNVSLRWSTEQPATTSKIHSRPVRPRADAGAEIESCLIVRLQS